MFPERQRWITRSLMILAVTGLLFTSNVFAEDYTYNLDETYRVASGGQISLFTDDAEVRITGSDRNDVHLVVNYERNIIGIYKGYESEPFEMEIESDGTNLTIHEIESKQSISGVLVSIDEEYEINIEAPRGMNIKLRGDDDQYRIENINGSIKVRLDDGQVRIRDCGSKEIRFEADDGVLDVFGGEGKLEGFIDDGRITIEEGKYDFIELGCDDGNLEVATSMAKDGGYFFNADDGTIKFWVLDGGGDFSLHFDDGRVRTSSQFETIEDEDDYKHLKLEGGNAKFRGSIDDGVMRVMVD